MTTEERLMELEIRLALQDELLSALNDTIARQQQTLDLQQAQLRLLYSKWQNQAETQNTPFNPFDEMPPHY